MIIFTVNPARNPPLRSPQKLALDFTPASALEEIPLYTPHAPGFANPMGGGGRADLDPASVRKSMPPPKYLVRECSALRIHRFVVWAQRTVCPLRVHEKRALLLPHASLKTIDTDCLHPRRNYFQRELFFYARGLFPVGVGASPDHRAGRPHGTLALTAAQITNLTQKAYAVVPGAFLEADPLPPIN